MVSNGTSVSADPLPPPTFYQEMVYSLKASCLKAHTPSDKGAVLAFVSQIFISVGVASERAKRLHLTSLNAFKYFPPSNQFGHSHSLFIINTAASLTADCV